MKETRRMITLYVALDSELDSFAIRDIVGRVGKDWRLRIRGS